MKMIQCPSCKSICDEGSHICTYCGSALQDEVAHSFLTMDENWPSFPAGEHDKANIDISAYSLLPPGDLFSGQNLPLFPHADRPAIIQNSRPEGTMLYSANSLLSPQPFMPQQPQQPFMPDQQEEDERDNDPILPLIAVAAGMPGAPESVPFAQGMPQLSSAPTAQGIPQAPHRSPLEDMMQSQNGHHRNHGAAQQHNLPNVPVRWALPDDIKRRQRTKRLIGGAIAVCVVLVTVIGWRFSHSGTSGSPAASHNVSSPTTSSTVTPGGTSGTTGSQQFHPTMISTGNMTPGGSITLHGTNFPPGGTVTFMIDGAALAYSSPPSTHAYASYQSGGRIPQTSQAALAAAPTVVKPDGSFDKIFAIPTSWEPGSTHHIRAAVLSGQSAAQVELGLQMQSPPTQGGATPTPTPTTCVGASLQQLNFTGVTGKSDPAAQTITVNNCAQSGNWSAAITTSDGAKWLSADKTSGSLASGATQSIVISALNVETNLPAGTYSGHITFTLGYSTITITVSLAVTNNPCIRSSSPPLTFNGIAGTSDPATQVVTIVNCGDTSNWMAQASTDNGAFWLTTSSYGGSLNGGASQGITVIASNVSVNLAPGTYTGSITFSIGPSSVTVKVTLNVAKGPCIQSNTQTLSFNGVIGQQNPSAQGVTLTNCGMGGNWTSSVSNNTGWLSVSPGSGTLNTGASQSVSISAALGNLKAGTYNGSLTFTTGSSSAVVAVTFVVTLAPCLQTNTQTLSFTGVAGTSNPAQQSLTLTNCGPSGSWSVSTSTNDGARWLTSNPTSGTLNTGNAQSIGVTVSSVTTRLGAGTYTGHLTFTQGSAKTTVTINLTITLPACLQITQVNGQSSGPSASASLSFSGNVGASASGQSVTISDCGANGTWSGSTSTQDGASWLTISSTSGSLNNGGTKDITVGINSAAITSANTYNGTVALSIQTANGTASVTVSVTYTVTQPACLQITQANGGNSASATLNFSGTIGGSNPASQSVVINNCGGSGTVSVSISTGSSWLTTDLSSGTALSAGSSHPVNVSPTLAGLTAGSYSATITITITTSSGTSTVTITTNLSLTVIG